MCEFSVHEKEQHEYFMREAIVEAKKAAKIGEVPIGAVIVQDGIIIARSHNRREIDQLATGHAELLAIQAANEVKQSWRLEKCQLYVTLEPCPMCSGAIINSRLQSVIYGASDEKAGTCGTLMNLVTDNRFNHQAIVIKGILEDECKHLLQQFFKSLRERNKRFKVSTQMGKDMDKKVQTILMELAQLENQSRLKHYENSQMPQPFFGVMMGELTKVAKKYAKQTDVALALFKSDYLEARLLAIKIAQPEAITEKDIEWISHTIFRENVAEEWVDKIISKRKDAQKWEEKWRNETDVLLQKMAWGLLAKRAATKKLTDDDVVYWLAQLNTQLVQLKEPLLRSANRVLVEIGIAYEKYRDEAIKIGEKYQLYADEIVPKGCTRAYAPEWIAARLRINASRNAKK